MAETVGDAPPTSRAKPTIQVPPRGSAGFLYANGSGPGFSPGPMTLVSSFFPEHSPFSYSQLLAGAMASPLAAKPGFSPAFDFGRDGRERDVSDDGKSSEAGVGRKWDRPVSLVVPPPQGAESMSPLFMVPPGLSPSGLLSPLQSPFGMSHQQALAHVTAQAALSQSFAQMQAEFHHSSSSEAAPNHSSSTHTEAPMQQTNPPSSDPDYSKKELTDVTQSIKSTAYGDKPANDGYNWRKYGQKQVKASECPRSYYKCTHPNCPVKKKVERSLDGHISEITYKGQHNHDPPKLNKREKDSSVLDATTNVQVNPVFAAEDRTERLNKAVFVNSDPSSFPTTSQQSLEPCAVANHKVEAKDSVIVVNDDADEPTVKRRSLDNGQSVAAGSESKIVLQTRSEVDLLDDGYKWRKYGQKVVKGNPHPRSYYRCTYAGCNVRKHVERASADPKSVITTYEGKHNHDIPMGKHGSSSQATAMQRVVAKNHSERSSYGSQDQIPTTLQLKEEQIVA
nr:WRKY transcription factor 2 [Ocimum tenuiflorum]WIE96213.1 WRKY transcription factor 2 [Ocimum tenuiflorum]